MDAHDTSAALGNNSSTSEGMSYPVFSMSKGMELTFLDPFSPPAVAVDLVLKCKEEHKHHDCTHFRFHLTEILNKFNIYPKENVEECFHFPFHGTEQFASMSTLLQLRREIIESVTLFENNLDIVLPMVFNKYTIVVNKKEQYELPDQQTHRYTAGVLLRRLLCARKFAEGEAFGSMMSNIVNMFKVTGKEIVNCMKNMYTFEYIHSNLYGDDYLPGTKLIMPKGGEICILKERIMIIYSSTPNSIDNFASKLKCLLDDYDFDKLELEDNNPTMLQNQEKYSEDDRNEISSRLMWIKQIESRGQIIQ